MKLSYHPDYYVELPSGHPFPMAKFPGVHDRLLASGIVAPTDVIAPQEAARELLVLAHTPGYLDKLFNFTLGRSEERKLGLPWTALLLRRSRLAVQGTVNAARFALRDGLAANCGGGTHHAMPDHAQGFCIFNDVVIAIRQLRGEGLIRRALVVDLDVHQGNGTAFMLRGDAAAFTFSMHGESNFPARKPPSDLDVGLPDGTGDEAYLHALRTHLPDVLDRARPDIVFYLGGVDVVAGDRYGKLALTPAGLRQRDVFVSETVHRAGIPLVLLLSGGYAATSAATAALHCIMHETARQVYAARKSGRRSATSATRPVL